MKKMAKLQSQSSSSDFLASADIEVLVAHTSLVLFYIQGTFQENIIIIKLLDNLLLRKNSIILTTL